MFKNITKINNQWEHELKNFIINENDNIKDNLIIKGDNLEVMWKIKNNFQWKVKMIYIDPPYNTGNNFIYKDKLEHNKWLSFMEERLLISKDFLRNDWIIFVQCDDREQAYLKILMDNIYGRNNFIWMFMWEKTSTPPNISKTIRKKLEYILCYKKDKQVKLNAWLVNWGDMPLINNWNNLTKLVFPPKTVFFKIKDGIYQPWVINKVKLLNELCIKEWTNLTPLILESEFKWKQEKLNLELKNGTIFLVKGNSFSIRYERKGDRIKVPSNIISKAECWVWTNDDAKKELMTLFLKKVFDYPKPESLIKYLLEIATQPWDLIMDFFLGSWTTTAVAHKMWRQYIGIEQMDYVKDIIVTRMKKVINWEQWWISKEVNWKGGNYFLFLE